MSNSACIATPVEDTEGDRRWLSMHERFKKECKSEEPTIVFIGDCLIQQMQNSQAWKKYFEPLHSLNFGITNDQTQHVLWRIENGELDFEVEPKVVVLLVGTHNVSNTAEQVAQGIIKIVKEIRAKLPKTSLIVLGIPPRGRDINILREKFIIVNNIVEKTLLNERDHRVKFLCCSRWHEFVNPQDGTISHTDMYDYLHFTNEGYEKFCEPIIEEINQLLCLYEK